MKLTRDPGTEPKVFNVEVARQRTLLSPLVYTALINSVDMEGELPEEMTAEMVARIEVEDHDPIVIKDTFSGTSFSGGRAPQSPYSQITSVVSLLNGNSYKPVRINRIECDTTILPGRKTADLEAIELASDTYAPGETLKATLFVRPYREPRQRMVVSLK